ncbi:hypothetical protein EV715DRAFT_214170, partial [Schizophyllum commune]
FLPFATTLRPRSSSSVTRPQLRRIQIEGEWNIECFLGLRYPDRPVDKLPPFPSPIVYAYMPADLVPHVSVDTVGLLLRAAAVSCARCLNDAHACKSARRVAIGVSDDVRDASRDVGHEGLRCPSLRRRSAGIAVGTGE